MSAETASPAGVAGAPAGDAGDVGDGGPLTSYLIGRLDRIVRRALDECLSEFGLTVLPYTALTVLRARPGLSNAQLARRSFMTPQGMNQVVAALADKGLVRRSPSVENRRVQHIELTEEGHRVVTRCNDLVADYERCLLEPLDPADREHFNRALRNLVDVNRHRGSCASRGS